MKWVIILGGIIFFILFGPTNFCFSQAKPKIKIVTTSTDLKAMAEAVGGDKVEVFSLAGAKQDLHFIEPKPSHIIKLRESQLFIRLGVGLDNWCEPLLKKAHNPKIEIGREGYLDVSQGIKILEVGSLDPTEADKKKNLHLYGNPHYWLDPSNGKIMIENITTVLTKLVPQEADFFKKNKAEYLDQLDKRIAEWQEKLKPYQGTKVITYHKSWTYFINFFGLKEVGVIEPKPGVPPSPKHIVAIKRLMKQENVKLILLETFYSEKVPEILTKETEAKIVVLPSSVDPAEKINTYLELFDHIVDKLVQVLSETNKNSK